MHISLDSALGRQRRLNSVGESVLQIAPNAAAAYSLRSLTGGDPKVVRVRRGSDNHEQDFTASEVSSGALTSFVNAQVVAPLDIQALSATGRDGDFLIAKAAYSLRSLGTRQATLAATGDTVARADGKYVVQVRRSTDDALKSFTADEVTDGTLLAFVNTPTNGVFANTGYESFTNASASGFTASNTGSTGFAISDILDGVSGDSVSVSFDIDITNGSPSISLRTALDGGSTASNSVVYTSSGSKTATLTANKGYVGIGFTEGDAPSNFTVSNFKIIADGFVKTWYDQSVTNQAGDTATGNHAVQGTAANQPKIVDAGSLIAGGLNFDGTAYQLTLSNTLGITSAASHFAVINPSGGGADTLFDNRDSGVDGYRIEATSSTKINFDWLSSDAEIDTISDQGLYYFNKTSSQVQSGANGGTLVTSSESGSVSVTTVPRIGARSFTSALNFFAGTINELIIYNSDQTDNRTAIEANIGEAYSIDLPSGVDPGFDQVDGFVETWYDQSGNNRPLIQTTASEQPLIVEAGTFLNGVKSNKATSNDTMQNLQVSTDGTNADFGTDDWASGASSVLGAVYVGTVPADSVVTTASSAIIWGGGRGVGSFQSGGLSLAVVKGGTDSWRIRNERQGLSPSSMTNSTSLNTDADVVLYGTTARVGSPIETRFTINVNGSGDTETESADLDVRENAALSLFGAYDGNGGRYYQRSSGGVCKECYLYAGDPVANIPALATSINAHYSIY